MLMNEHNIDRLLTYCHLIWAMKKYFNEHMKKFILEDVHGTVYVEVIFDHFGELQL